MSQVLKDWSDLVQKGHCWEKEKYEQVHKASKNSKYVYKTWVGQLLPEHRVCGIQDHKTDLESQAETRLFLFSS